jgi:pyruvate dehydrogenase E2 component (dihydrolipoamide acetyltransferase)
MAFEFHLPDLAEGMVEAEIVSWKVAVGDVVSMDQPIVEVMSDKATVEIPAPAAGTISAINYKEGDVAEVGAVLFVIDVGGDVAATPAADAGNGSTPQPAAPEQSMSVQAASHAPPAIPVVDVTSGRKRVRATPATRRLARQLGVDISMVTPTGRRGRVSSDDVRAFADDERATAPGVESPRPAQHQQHQQARTAVSIPSESPELEERIPFRGVRKRIADNMVRSKFTATHFTYVEEIDVTELVAVRARAKSRAAERGLKLTYLPFLMKAVVAGLKKWPGLNAALDETTNEIVRKKYYHLGIAAQGPQGLVVTVVRDCDKRSIFDIAAEIARLAAAVESGAVTREDLTGSTFTISSLGKLGGVLATPIINFPEVGVLGVHKIEDKPAVRGGEIVIRSLMNLSISLDHRLVDGWDGAMFLQEVKALLEDPTLMFMEMI